MITKVYVVTQALDQMDPAMGETVVAVRLTFEAALSIARLDGGRRVQKFEATKDHTPDPVGSTQRSSHGRTRTEHG